MRGWIGLFLVWLRCRCGWLLSRNGHRIELLLLVRSKQGLDLGPGIFHRLLHRGALGFHVLLHLGGLCLQDRFDLGLLIVGQSELF